MNIGLFTDTYYPELNGVANSTYQLKKALEKIGHRVYVFTVSNPEVVEMEYGVIRFASLPCALIKERRVGFSLSRLFVKKIQLLNLDIIHTQTEFGMGHLGRKIANQLKIPVVHTYHTIYEDYTHYLKVPGNDKLKGVARQFSRRCCEHADYIIVPTDKIKKILENYGVKKKIIAQPTGVDFEKFRNCSKEKMEEIRKKYTLKKSDHILVSIGRLSKEKNISELITFIDKIRKKDSKIKLLIVGEGPEKNHLEKKVQELGLTKHVIFTGAVSWQIIENYFALGNAFVCASQSETQGLTYIEALATGTPILVHNDPCLKGVLQEGINGYGYNTYEEFLSGYKNMVWNEEFLSKNRRKQIADSIMNLSVEGFAKNISTIYRMAVQNSSNRKDYNVGERFYHMK